MKPEAEKNGALSKKELGAIFERLRDVKKAELLCGIHINRDEALLADGPKLLATIEDTFKTVLPLYQEAQKAALVHS